MSVPATYVERQPTVTAVQWDGTKDAISFVITAYNGRASLNDDGGIDIENAVSSDTLEQGLWVVKLDDANTVTMTDEEFTRRYALGS